MTSRRSSLADIAAARGVRDARVLQALREVPRSRFVPDQHAHLAEIDAPVPIGKDQVTSQPSLIAAMIEALDLHGDEVILEVGTGYGYQTALLAALSRFTWSVERWPDLADAARANLRAVGIPNAEVVTGDGTEGLPEHAPYDGIVVSAAFPTVPPPLVEQLRDGGRLVQPLGHGGDESVTLFERREGTLQRVRLLTLARFVRLMGAHAFPVGGEASSSSDGT